MRKTVLFTAILITLLISACQSNQKGTANLLQLVPAKTSAVLKTNNFTALSSQLDKNTLINSNKTLPIVDYFETIQSDFSNLTIDETSLICFTKIGRSTIATTLITENNPELYHQIGYENITGFSYNGEEIKEYKLGGSLYYGVKLKDKFIFGNSKLVVENIIRLAKEQLSPDSKLVEVYQSSKGEPNTLFINPNEFESLITQLLPHYSVNNLGKFSNWMSLDLNISASKLLINGVSLPNKNQILGLLKNTKPKKNKLAEVTPISAIGLYSVTFSNIDELKKNIAFYRKENYPKLKVDLLENAVEIGIIYNQDDAVFALRSTKSSALDSKLSSTDSLVETHRGMAIKKFATPHYFKRALSPLIQLNQLQYYTKINDFFLFAKNQTTLETLIANYQNKTLITNREAYQNLKDNLDENSSILLIGITDNLKKSIANKVSESNKEAYENMATDDYKLAALQFITHDNFTYINGRIEASEAHEKDHGGILSQSIKPGEKIAAGPWTFINWRTKHYDIVLQGESNTLYVYNEEGKLRWKKQLDGRILGKIQPIDIYQNRRIQMAFVTPHTFYIIDREGNVVKPFNKSFKNRITQPLALFDYNHNGRFRFIITQSNRLTMLDKHLKIVDGFEFTKAESTILQTPKHFRIGTKDYILIPEKSGKLHILNPRGETRVAVNQDIDFSDNQWYLYENTFTSTTDQGNLIQINPNGNVTKTKLGLKDDQHLFATAHTLVTFSGNTLTIKGKKTTLDYGLYTTPQIFYLNDKIYISITDTQAHKVYLFDSNSQLLSGFPIYGNSKIVLQNIDNQGGLELLVKGEDDSILIYNVN